jgi:tRNA (cytidine/uridine-2'-O-)-methyltransferase
MTDGDVSAATLAAAPERAARRATQPAQRIGRADGRATDAPLHLVLVEPQIPPNTGNVARLCAATGCVLHLVEPLGFSIDDRDLKRAGLDYWHAVDVCVHRSLDAFAASWTAPLWLLSTRATRAYADAPFARGDALVFGKETAGLPQAFLDAHPTRALRIPMRDDSVRSLNLSTSVGIVAYAALAALGFPDLR